MRMLLVCAVIFMGCTVWAAEPNFDIVGSAPSPEQPVSTGPDFRLFDGPSVVKIKTYENDGVRYMVMPSGRMCPISTPDSYKGWAWDVDDQTWYRKKEAPTVATVSATPTATTNCVGGVCSPAPIMSAPMPMAMPMMSAPMFGGGGFMGGGSCGGGG